MALSLPKGGGPLGGAGPLQPGGGGGGLIPGGGGGIPGGGGPGGGAIPGGGGPGGAAPVNIKYRKKKKHTILEILAIQVNQTTENNSGFISFH